MAAIDIRSLNPNQLPGIPTEGGVDPALVDTTGTSAAARLQAARNFATTDAVIGAEPAGSPSQGGAVALNAPALPDPEGTAATPQAASALLDNTTMFDKNLAAPISSAEAFNILQKSAMTGYALSSVINRAANMTSIEAKKSEAGNLMKQVEGEREHAAVTFGASIFAALAGIAVPMMGSRMAKGSASQETPGAPPVAGAGGAPGASGAATTSASTAAAAGRTNTTNAGKNAAGKNADPNAKALDPNAATNVPGGSSPGASAMAAKEKKRQAEQLLAQQKSQAGPSTQGQGAAPAQNSGAPSADPGRPGPGNGGSTAADRLDGTSAVQQRMIDQGQALTQAGPAVGAVITSGAEMYDKTSSTGGQYEADVAKIAQKQDAINAQIADLAKDTSKSSQEQALEILKAAQALTQSYSQRWTEVNNNIANR